MIRFTTAVLLPSLFLIAACSVSSDDNSVTGDSDVHFSLVVFDGASSETRAAGELTRADYKKWFLQDYSVGGERIETAKSAKSVGALIIVDGSKVLAMPLSTWQTEGSTTYFACQSTAIGRAPMFSVCTEAKTKTEFLGQIEQRITNLP